MEPNTYSDGIKRSFEAYNLNVTYRTLRAAYFILCNRERLSYLIEDYNESLKFIEHNILLDKNEPCDPKKIYYFRAFLLNRLIKNKDYFYKSIKEIGKKGKEYHIMSKNEIIDIIFNSGQNIGWNETKANYILRLIKELGLIYPIKIESKKRNLYAFFPNSKLLNNIITMIKKERNQSHFSLSEFLEILKEDFFPFLDTKMKGKLKQFEQNLIFHLVTLNLINIEYVGEYEELQVGEKKIDSIILQGGVLEYELL